MNAWTYMRELNEFCYLMSRERAGRASNGELKRWCQNGAVEIDGEKVDWDKEVIFPIDSVVLFPNGKKVSM